MPEIRHLSAPKLDQSKLGTRVLCHRPCRRGPPRMGVEWRGVDDDHQMLIGHNYGHAGSGWTLAPGAVKHVNQLVIEAFCQQTNENPNALGEVPIHVLGAGIIGLFTAYDLVRRGHRNLTIIAEHFDELASHNAGGLVSPTAMEIEDAQSQALVDKIAIDAYQYFAQIANGENDNFPRECAKFIPLYFDEGSMGSMDAYVRAGVMQASKSVLVQFDSAPPNRPPRPMMAFDDAIFVEPHTMMQTLRQFLHSKGVQFIQQRVHSFDDLRKCQIVMNCTGIGAKQLCDDQLIHSVQGHLILLKDQEPSEMNYMLIHWFEEDSANGQTSGQSIKRAFYVFPKRSSTTDPRAIGVIGGTFIDGADTDTPNTDEFELVLKNARNFLAGNN